MGEIYRLPDIPPPPLILGDLFLLEKLSHLRVGVNTLTHALPLFITAPLSRVPRPFKGVPRPLAPVFHPVTSAMSMVEHC